MGTIWSKKKQNTKGSQGGSKGQPAAASKPAASSSSQPQASSSGAASNAKPKSASPRSSMEKRPADAPAPSESTSTATSAGSSTAAAAKPASDSVAGAASPSKPALAQDDVRNILVNQWEIAKAILLLVGEISTAEFGTPEFWDAVEAQYKAASTPLAILKNEKMLQKWTAPLSKVQTGSVLINANGLMRAYEAVGQKIDALKPQHPPTATNKAQLREAGKLLYQSYFTFYTSCELILPDDMNRYVLETAKIGEEVLNFALGNVDLPLSDRVEIGANGEEIFIPAPTREEFFEAQVRRFATQAVSLARASNTRAIQQQSYETMRQFNDSSFTVVRSAKVMAVMGHRAVVDPTDVDANKSLYSLAKGLAGQFEKLSGLALSNAQRELNYSLTPEIVAQYIKLYDTGIKDLNDALEEFQAESGRDELMHKMASQVVVALEIIKKLMDAPDAAKMLKATVAMMTCVESLATQTFLLFGKKITPAQLETLTKNPIVKEQMMLSLVSVLHHMLQFVLAALSKISYFPVLPPEISQLNAARGLLASLSVLFNSCVFVLHYTKEERLAEGAEEGLDPRKEPATEQETAQAILDILHYVRPVKEIQSEIVKSDEKRQEQERDELLEMMQTTVGLKPASPRKSEPEPPKPEIAKPQPAATPAKPADTVRPPDFIPKTQTTPAKPAEPEKKPLATSQPSNTGAGQATKKDDGKGKGKDDLKDSKGKENLKDYSKVKADPKGKGKEKEPAKPDPKAKTTAAATPAPAKAATPAPAPAASSSSSSTPAPAPATAATAAALPAVNPDGSIPCPVAGLPPLPAGWKIDDVTETNLPPGFPDAPPKAVPLAKGASEDEYKNFMKVKYERETWDNKLILYKIRMTNILKQLGKM